MDSNSRPIYSAGYGADARFRDIVRRHWCNFPVSQLKSLELAQGSRRTLGTRNYRHMYLPFLTFLVWKKYSWKTSSTLYPCLCLISLLSDLYSDNNIISRLLYLILKYYIFILEILNENWNGSWMKRSRDDDRINKSLGRERALPAISFRHTRVRRSCKMYRLLPCRA